ncbi:hypothetical protein [Anaeromyxobacter oryzae]|uniref:hypothetical protein n=1 Tax=Anaeromyxobacter oryzae TaxID=2918170 RepID=UPI0020C0C209|nr:hypothetical protein [Anaeromyxobacter oryzae]
MQLVRHASPAALQVYSPQLPELATAQVPVPSQVAAGVTVPPLQEPGAHTVEAGQSAQLPVPSQTPALPQVDGADAAQSFLGSLPATLDVQVPRAPPASHRVQVPVQAVLQQTPSTQKPLAQAPGAAQASPSGAAQTLPLQAPLAQSPLEAQVLAVPQRGQVVPPQSTSVSVPFLTASAQLGDWHEPDAQTPLEQSRPRTQALPSAHAGQAPPPQSTPVSAPSRIPSTQVGVVQTFARQSPPAQSVPVRHWTQVPAPSHSVPPFAAQGAPAALSCWPGTPAVQEPEVHGPAEGTSASSFPSTR